MKKIILSLSIILGLSVSALGLPTAVETNKVTQQSKKDKIKSFMANKEKKAVYQELMKLLEDNISNISKNGFYDTMSITLYNNKKLGIEAILKKLDDNEENVLRNIIINELIGLGYTIKYNQYWNNPNMFAISISWNK